LVSIESDSVDLHLGASVDSLPGVDSSPIDGGYTLWAQAGGYFDGDGSVRLTVDSPEVLRFALVWVENSFDQLRQLRAFLQSEGIAVGRVLNHSAGAFRLQIGSPKSVLAAAKLMEKFCFKKRKELRILIDYYEDRITGTAALLGLNQLVVQRVRLGRIRPLKSLPRYSEGKHNVARARGRGRRNCDEFAS
jgi:hypothetical protein